MKGRDELEKLFKCTCLDAYKSRGMTDPSCWGCEFKDAIPDIIDILMTHGWASPETLANEYVRLDAIEEIVTEAEIYDEKHGFHKRPETGRKRAHGNMSASYKAKYFRELADLIGGKG